MEHYPAGLDCALVRSCAGRLLIGFGPRVVAPSRLSNRGRSDHLPRRDLERGRRLGRPPHNDGSREGGSGDAGPTGRNFEFAPSPLCKSGRQVGIGGIGDERCPATVFLRHTVRAINRETASLCCGFLCYSNIAIIVSGDGSNRQRKCSNLGQAIGELVHPNCIRARIRADKDEAIIGGHSARRVTTADKRQSEFFARGDADRIAVAGYNVGLFEYVPRNADRIAAPVQHVNAACDCISDPLPARLP